MINITYLRVVARSFQEQRNRGTNKSIAPCWLPHNNKLPSSPVLFAPICWLLLLLVGVTIPSQLTSFVAIGVAIGIVYSLVEVVGPMMIGADCHQGGGRCRALPMMSSGQRLFCFRPTAMLLAVLLLCCGQTTSFTGPMTFFHRRSWGIEGHQPSATAITGSPHVAHRPLAATTVIGSGSTKSSELFDDDNDSFNEDDDDFDDDEDEDGFEYLDRRTGRPLGNNE